jgi:hypothetical protein
MFFCTTHMDVIFVNKYFHKYYINELCTETCSGMPDHRNLLAEWHGYMIVLLVSTDKYSQHREGEDRSCSTHLGLLRLPANQCA